MDKKKRKFSYSRCDHNGRRTRCKICKDEGTGGGSLCEHYQIKRMCGLCKEYNNLSTLIKIDSDNTNITDTNIIDTNITNVNIHVPNKRIIYKTCRYHRMHKLLQLKLLYCQSCYNSKTRRGSEKRAIHTPYSYRYEKGIIVKYPSMFQFEF